MNRPVFTARDYIAGLVIIALVAFKLTGHNGSLDVAVALIIGYYFGRRDDPTLHVSTMPVGPERELELKRDP